MNNTYCSKRFAAHAVANPRQRQNGREDQLMTAAIGRILGVLSLILLGASGVRAQTGPISLLVGYSAGGSADFVARIMASELSTHLGRTVIVENAAGASGMIALQRLVNAPADGNAIYFGGFDTVTVPMVNPKVKID